MTSEAESLISQPPNPLTDKDQAMQIANWIKRIAAERYDHQIMMVVNDHDESALVPERDYTYGEKIARLTEGIARIRTAFPPELIKQVDELLANQ